MSTPTRKVGFAQEAPLWGSPVIEPDDSSPESPWEAASAAPSPSAFAASPFTSSTREPSRRCGEVIHFPGLAPRGEVSSASGCQAAAAAATVELQLGRHLAVVADSAMHHVFALARRLARAAFPVVIHGETGVGKELVAAALHAWSRRADGPFITLNCAAIPDALAESELFGHARGAFTGAVVAREGLLEAASGGTLFLDEIAELSPTMQARLLRVLEQGEVCRLGETTARRIDLRIVCASLKDLDAEVQAGRFRQDLFFRLGSARLEVPPLRARPADLVALTHAFLGAACARAGRPGLTPSAAALLALRRHGWPGNVRELRHVLECAVALAADDDVVLTPAQLRLPGSGAPSVAAESPRGRLGRARGTTPPRPAAVFRPVAEELEALERLRMVEALRACGGVQISAAALISMPLRTFATKLRRYRIGAADLQVQQNPDLDV